MTSPPKFKAPKATKVVKVSRLVEGVEQVTSARQPGDGYIPGHPTKGWCLHELKAIGAECPDDAKQPELVASLRRLGYDVKPGSAPSLAPENER